MTEPHHIWALRHKYEFPEYLVDSDVVRAELYSRRPRFFSGNLAQRCDSCKATGGRWATSYPAVLYSYVQCSFMCMACMRWALSRAESRFLFNAHRQRKNEINMLVSRLKSSRRISHV